MPYSPGMSDARTAPPPEAARHSAASWRPVLLFILVAYGLGWAAQIALSLVVRGGDASVTRAGGGLVLIAGALMWPPALGAFAARRLERRSPSGRGLPGLGWRRGPWRYVAIGWLSPLLLVLAAMLLSLPLYPLDLEFRSMAATFERAGVEPPAPLAVLAWGQVAAALTVAVPINGVFALGEELGWRGYLLPRLVGLLGPWPGLLAHGAIWGFWHAPIVLLISYNYPGHPYLGVPWFTIFGVLFGIWLGWLRLASGSVWPPTVAHAAFNAAAGLPFLVQRDVDPILGGTLHSPIGWLVLLALAAWLARTGRLWAASDAAGRPDPAVGAGRGRA
jgi:uncharacterized protein